MLRTVVLNLSIRLSYWTNIQSVLYSPFAILKLGRPYSTVRAVEQIICLVSARIKRQHVKSPGMEQLTLTPGRRLEE